MKKTVGGFRAAQFETIVAADRGDYADKFIYCVEGLPGVWRRVKPPRVNPASVGVVACWYDGGVIYLEHCVSANEELAHAVKVDQTAEINAFMDELHTKREEAMMRERGTEPGDAAASQEGGAESAQPSASALNGSTPGEVEV